jgi:hypothetical protein
VHYVPEWSTNEDRPTKRHGIEEMVSNSDIITDLSDEFHTPWLLWSGALIKREDGE